MTGTSGCMDHQAGQGKAHREQARATPGPLPARPCRPAWVAGHGPSLPDRTTVAGAAQVRRTRLLATIHRGCMHACRRRTPSCFPLNCKARKRPASTNRTILRGPEKIFRVAAPALSGPLQAGRPGVKRVKPLSACFGRSCAAGTAHTAWRPLSGRGARPAPTNDPGTGRYPRVVPSRAPSAARPLRRQPAWASRAPVPRCRSPRTARRAGGSRGCHQGCRRSSRACRQRRPSSTALRCAAR